MKLIVIPKIIDRTGTIMSTTGQLSIWGSFFACLPFFYLITNELNEMKECVN